MIKVTIERFLPAEPDEVWAVVGVFHEIHLWHPLVPNCRASADGGSRVIEIPGSEIVETLVPERCGQRSHAYTVGQTPMPLRDYLASLEVQPAPGGALVVYRSTFEADGAPEETARTLIERFFEAGFDALAKRFSG